MLALLSRHIRLLFVLATIAAITALHYGTSTHQAHLHEIFRRLYYIPIILSAFWFGLRGGIGSAIAVSLFYLPHVMFQWGGDYLLNFMEIVLYNIVGGVTGLMASAERRQRDRYERASKEIEEAYQKLQAQTLQLRAAERLSVLGELAAGMAHEIKNPLGSIKGTAEILTGDALSEEDRAEFGRILIKEVDRLDAVLRSYLRLARSTDAARRRIVLKEALRSTVTLVGAYARKREVTIQAEVEEGIEVIADEGQITQAFLNVLLNAVAASESGGKITITARVGEEKSERESGRVGEWEKNLSPFPPFPHSPTQGGGGWVEVRVMDTGCGIPDEHLDRVFTPLFTTRPDGTGLGLPITRRIVEAHGGSIRVASRVGEGTAVTIALPAAPHEVTGPGSTPRYGVFGSYSG
jgi:signal transduction histidine kinase